MMMMRAYLFIHELIDETDHLRLLAALVLIKVHFHQQISLIL